MRCKLNTHFESLFLNIVKGETLSFKSILNTFVLQKGEQTSVKMYFVFSIRHGSQINRVVKTIPR